MSDRDPLSSDANGGDPSASADAGRPGGDDPNGSTERDDSDDSDDHWTDRPNGGTDDGNPNPGPATAGPAAGDAADGTGGPASRGRRDVEVPMRVYKTVTVFSTLIAVTCVVLGFVLLDAATLQVSFLRGVIAGAIAGLGVPVDRSLLSAVLALAGLAIIGLGAGTYVLGTRFRAPGMGNSQEDSDEPSDNG